MTDTYKPNPGDQESFSNERCLKMVREHLVHLLRHCSDEIDEASWEAMSADRPHDPNNLLRRLAIAISGVSDEVIAANEAAIAAYYAAHPEETK